MKILTSLRAFALPPRPLPVLLVISVLTNILFAIRLYYPNVVENLLAAMASPPIAVSTDHIRGNPDAKVTVIAYTDFECTYCARLHATLRTATAETNIRWVYRHFPLRPDTRSARAAEAAECAGAHGKFWEFSDALFAPDYKIENDTTLIATGMSLGLDADGFEACLTSGKYRDRVAGQRAEGVGKVVRGTPTFFVNGKRFIGAIPIDQLKPELIKIGL